MNNLNMFCKIIAELRKERGWTQTHLAEKLGIAPQSISKWECGIGYPDVTLFPMIAELFDVSVAILFGESYIKERKMKNSAEYAFERLTDIKIIIGNVCRIEIIDGEDTESRIIVEGDATFIDYFNIEKEFGKLFIRVSNPTGSCTNWIPYDRDGYAGENIIKIFTGCAYSNVTIENYLDLNVCQRVNENGNYEWVCAH